MNLIAIDFVCGLPETSDGFTVGLIIIDCVTCFVFLCSLKSKSLKAVAEALLEVFYNFGFPQKIQSNQDPLFMSESIDKFRELTEAHSRKILKYFPAQNGMVERYVKKVNNVLKKMMHGEGTYWVKFLPVIQLLLNDWYISHHKSMLFACMFGRKVNQARNYEKIELEVTTPEQLLERNWNLVHVVYPAFVRLFAASGKLDCKSKNSERKEKKILKDKPLKVETTVMKKVNVKEMKWQQEWEEPFKIKSYDSKTKSYDLVYLMGTPYANKVPISQLKVVKAEVKVDELYEVEKILENRGPVGKKEYWVKWKGFDEKSWIPATDFFADDLIQKYHLEASKSKKYNFHQKKWLFLFCDVVVSGCWKFYFCFCCDFLFCCVIFGENVHLGGVSGCKSVLTLKDVSWFGVVLLFPLCFPD